MGKRRPQPHARVEKTTFYREVEISLSRELGRKVRVAGSEGKGSLTIDFYSDEELSDMAERLCAEK